MEKFYSMFIASDELYACPEVARYGHRHDYTLTVSESVEIDIPLPFYLTATSYQDINLLYNPHMLDIFSARVTKVERSFSHSTTLHLKITPRELGSTHVGVASTWAVQPDREQRVLHIDNGALAI